MTPGKNLGKIPKNDYEEVAIIEETPNAHLKSTQPEQVEATIEKSADEKLFEAQREIIQGLKECKGNPDTEEFLSQEHWDKPLKPVFIPKNHPLMPILDYAKKISVPGKPIEFKLRELFAYPLKQEKPIPQNVPKKVRDLLAVLEKSNEKNNTENFLEPTYSKFGQACANLLSNLGSGYGDMPLADALKQFERETMN